MPEKEKVVALYVRVSTGYQVDKDSLPFQKKELKNYCEHVLHINKTGLKYLRMPESQERTRSDRRLSE